LSAGEVTALRAVALSRLASLLVLPAIHGRHACLFAPPCGILFFGAPACSCSLPLLSARALPSLCAPPHPWARRCLTWPLILDVLFCGLRTVLCLSVVGCLFGLLVPCRHGLPLLYRSSALCFRSLAAALCGPTIVADLPASLLRFASLSSVFGGLSVVDNLWITAINA
jgi:hypothetical protein